VIVQRNFMDAGGADVATIERFEDIRSWQKGRELCGLVYQVTGKGAFSRDYSLREQMRRAAVSIVSNIAEGFESQNNRNFVRYLYMAKGSAGEVRAQCYVALDQQYINQETFDQLHRLTTETSRMIAAFIAYLSTHT
jgi:four helix bundle protein